MKREYRLLSLTIQGAFAPAQDGTLPTRIKVFRWGVNETKKGPVIVNDTTVRELPLNQVETGFDVISLDYEHNTVPGTKAYEESKEPRDIAAQLKVEVVPGDGVYVQVLNWTPTGKEKAINFVDLSPAPGLNDNRELVFLHSVALTRAGATDDLHFLTLSLDVTTKETNAMTPEQLKKMLEEMFANSMKPVLDRLMVLEKGGDANRAAIETLSVDVKSAKETAAQIKAETVEGRRQAIVAAAKAAGKVLPLSVDDIKVMDLTMLQRIADATPATVPVTTLTPLNVPDPSAGVSPSLAMICKITGQDPQKVLEANRRK